MDPPSLTILVLIIATIIYLYFEASCFTCTSKEKQSERYTNVFPYYCKDCNIQNKNSCLKCYNCGYKVDKNRGQCVPGDVYGPQNPTYKCNGDFAWYHNDPYSYMVNGFMPPYAKEKAMPPYTTDVKGATFR